jgi:ketosteroid isomerase-like protein/fermentation-respiration switch protein FrsA (DUF1100 family)
MKNSLLFLASSLAASASLLSAADVRVERVTFTSGGETLVGALYLPAAATVSNPAAGVVVTGAWMTVKEQMPGRYARELAQRGYAALTFDFRGWGESGGNRRQLENPDEKIADMVAAVAFLGSRAEVDPARMGGLGICASSGYMMAAATHTTALKSVALVAPWLQDRAIVEQVYGGAEGIARLLAGAETAEASFRATGRQTFVPAASLTDRNAIMFGAPYYTETDRGLIPAWRNEADPAFWSKWLWFDGLQYAPRLRQPFLIVHSDAAAIPQGARRFFAAATAPKTEVWLDGVTQLDFYDRAGPVTQAVDAVTAHFQRTLSPANRPEGRTAGAVEGVREFFCALEAMDIPRFLELWAEDAVQEMPYAPGSFPRRLTGKAAIAAQYGPLPAAFTGMKFMLRRVVATAEPGVVLAEWDGAIGLKAGGRYDNRYVGLFRFNAAGKLAHFTEYFDPYTLIHGFPGAADAALTDRERIERSIAALAATADARDWTALRRLFAEQVYVDYTSVTGGTPVTLAADALVAGWQHGLGSYRRTKHHFSDVRVVLHGDRATATFTGQATHEKPDGTRWSCGGDYTYEFARTEAGWKAASAQFVMRWEQGQR